MHSAVACGVVRGVKIYRIRVVPERAPNVSRTFEFAASHRLHDVHLAIQDAFELDDDHLFAFFMSGKHWDKATEISGGTTPSDPGQAARVNLAQLGLKPGKRFSYVFDFGDEHWHSLEVESVLDTPRASPAPRLVESIGEPPPQYDDLPELSADELRSVETIVPVAEALLQIFEDAEDEAAANGDGPHEGGAALPLQPEALRAAQELASTLARELKGDAARLALLERAVDADLLSALGEVPLEMAGAGRVDDALVLVSSLSALDPESFLADRALILASAGRREEALAQIAHNLESKPNDAWVQVGAAEAHVALGDEARAEELLRAALEGSHDPMVREEVLARLNDLLQKRGHTAELAAPGPAQLARHSTVNTPNTVGRNDPCPCGSGKKYKRCCLT
ncbi:MAG TPA: SEC-C metal-binding domain-containing protein [Polyangiaceae bacterium]|nr:SEC-C metal-binding domain-containing protein [Polyangiaceae bacterium]